MVILVPKLPFCFEWNCLRVLGEVFLKELNIYQRTSSMDLYYIEYITWWREDRILCLSGKNNISRVSAAN